MEQPNASDMCSRHAMDTPQGVTYIDIPSWDYKVGKGLHKREFLIRPHDGRDAPLPVSVLTNLRYGDNVMWRQDEPLEFKPKRHKDPSKSKSQLLKNSKMLHVLTCTTIDGTKILFRMAKNNEASGGQTEGGHARAGAQCIRRKLANVKPFTIAVNGRPVTLGRGHNAANQAVAVSKYILRSKIVLQFYIAVRADAFAPNAAGDVPPTQHAIHTAPGDDSSSRPPDAQGNVSVAMSSDISFTPEEFRIFNKLMDMYKERAPAAYLQLVDSCSYTHYGPAYSSYSKPTSHVAVAPTSYFPPLQAPPGLSAPTGPAVPSGAVSHEARYSSAPPLRGPFNPEVSAPWPRHASTSTFSPGSSSLDSFSPPPFSQATFSRGSFSSPVSVQWQEETYSPPFSSPSPSGPYAHNSAVGQVKQEWDSPRFSPEIFSPSPISPASSASQAFPRRSAGASSASRHILEWQQDLPQHRSVDAPVQTNPPFDTYKSDFIMADVSLSRDNDNGGDVPEPAAMRRDDKDAEAPNEPATPATHHLPTPDPQEISLAGPADSAVPSLVLSPFTPSPQYPRNHISSLLAYHNHHIVVSPYK